MKYVGILASVLLLFGCSDNKSIEVGNKTTMEVAPEVFDAGEVIKGEVVTAKFIIKNTGEYPLVIGEVKGSCSCTVASYPEEPIPPGGEGEILSHVNTDDLGVGPLNKAVRIVANTTPSVSQVIVRGDIMRK